MSKPLEPNLEPEFLSPFEPPRSYEHLQTLAGIAEFVKSSRCPNKEESLDIISGKGSMQEAPMFLVKALRQIIYRLQQAMLWSGDNDVRLYVAKQYFIEFMSAWAKVFPPIGFPPVNPVRQMVENGEIEIDGIKIQVKEAFGDSINLGVFRVDDNELIRWDEDSTRILFRAPWTTAKFEIVP